MQMTAKIGGCPWAISDMPLCDAPLMLIGYDVHHTKGQRSTLALWNTNSRDLNKGNAQTRPQEPGEEIASCLEELVSNAITNFREQNGGRAPERIFFMRDGVGDSQKHAVMKSEIQ